MNCCPRWICDYSWYLVNQEILSLAAMESMKFGHALDRILRETLLANPAHGPVLMNKTEGIEKAGWVIESTDRGVAVWQAKAKCQNGRCVFEVDLEKTDDTIRQVTVHDDSGWYCQDVELVTPANAASFLGQEGSVDRVILKALEDPKKLLDFAA